MEEYYGNLKGYCKRRAYQKLHSGGRRARSKIKLGGGWRQRLWRIKVSLKLKILQKVWLKRIFARIHQGCVRTMLGFADKLWFSHNDGTGRIRRPPAKEYDDRQILRLQKLLLEQNHG